MEALKAVAGVTEVEVVREAEGVAALRVLVDKELRPELVKALVAANVDVLRVDRGAARLENIFLTLTHGKEVH
jgi:ABC-2 type transport system ATP-binding protein